jgi:hypothetical protein
VELQQWEEGCEEEYRAKFGKRVQASERKIKLKELIYNTNHIIFERDVATNKNKTSMEEKKLTEKESLELITQMIQSTKEEVEKGSGTYFLIFGYTSTLVALFIYMIWRLTGNPLIFWAWWLIPIIGYSIVYFKRRNAPKRVITGVDTIIWKIWIVSGICCCVSPIVSMFVEMPILFLESFIVTSTTAMLGLIIKSKVLTIFSFISIGLSYTLLFVPSDIHIPIFAAMFVIIMIIPGHLLNAIATHNHKNN